MPTVPCKGCTDRRQGCHGQCERYAAYHARMNEALEKRATERDADALTVAAIDRMKKKRTRRK